MTDQQVDQQTDLRTNKAGCSRVARDKKCCKSENTLIGNWVFSFKLATLSGALPNNAEKANGIRPASRPTNQHSGLLSCGVACDYKLRMFKNIHHRFLSCSFSGEYSSMTFDLFPPPLPLIIFPATCRAALENLWFCSPYSNETVSLRFKWC